MTCEMAKQQLSLFLYGELSFDEEETLEQHLEACAGCRAELSREKAMHRAMGEAGLAPPIEMLRECRRELRSKIFASGMDPRGTWWTRFQQAWAAAFPSGGLLRPVAALTLVAIGFFSARLTVSPESPAGPRLAGVAEPVMSRVRNIEPDASGRVQIVVDETRQRVLSGRLDDDNIRRLLLTAAKDPSDPGLRVESMDILKGRCDSAEVRRALLYAIQHDPNPGVRLKALEGLKPFGADPETRKVLAQVLLADDNPGVRTQAIDLLIQQKQQDVVAVLQELLRKEDNGYVRLRSQKALRDMGASVETF